MQQMSESFEKKCNATTTTISLQNKNGRIKSKIKLFVKKILILIIRIFKMESPKASITAGPPLTHEEICKNATILDEGISLCPLCTSEVRLFFINFNEKILMCENVECEYPFGQENIVYVKEDNEVQSDEEVCSIKTKTVKSSLGGSLSMVSTSAWSEIDKINRLYDSEEQLDHRPEMREYFTHRKVSSTKVKKEENKDLLNKVEVIKKLNRELAISDDDTFVKPQIKNEKWIKNLLSKQIQSGKSLLAPSEMKLIQRKQPDFGLGELKIDIDVGGERKMSCVKIEIMNTAKEK